MRAFSASLAVYTLAILDPLRSVSSSTSTSSWSPGCLPFQAGLWTLPSFGAFIVGSMLAPALVSGPAAYVWPGARPCAVGFALLTQVGIDTAWPLFDPL